MLRAEHGMEGYGIYWGLLEMMFESSDSALSHSKTKGIAVSYNIDITVLESVINTAITEGLFVSDDDKFWSDSLIRRKGKFQELKRKRSEAGKKGMAKRWENRKKDNSVITNDNNVISNEGADITKNNKGKESKGKESKQNNYTPEFEQFWKMYPRKIEKKQAAKAFKTANKKYGLDKIVAGTKGYAESLRKSGTDEGFIKHASTFLNNDSFLEYGGGSETNEVADKEQEKIDEIYERRNELIGALELPDRYYQMMGESPDREAKQRELDDIDKWIRNHQKQRQADRDSRTGT